MRAKLTVIPVPCGKDAYVSMAIPVGSRDEAAGFHGMAHFLEHVLFKGTATFEGVDDLHKTIIHHGGSMNAYTTHEVTNFHCHVPATVPAIHDALRVVVSMTTEPLLPPDPVQREVRVVQQEIAKYKDIPDRTLYDHMVRFLAGADHGLGSHSISGEAEDVADFDAAKAREFMRRHYTKALLTVGVPAKLHRSAVTSARRVMGQYGVTEVDHLTDVVDYLPAMAPPVAGPPRGDLVHEREGLAQSHLMCCSAQTTTDPRVAVICHLLCHTLGGHMSSRLWQHLREKHSLAYGVNFGVSVFRDMVMAHLHLATSHDKHAVAKAECEKEIRKVADGTRPITAEETTRSLRSLIGNLSMQQHKPSAVVETFVHNALRMPKPWSIGDEIYIYEQLLENVDLTVAGLQECARRMLHPSRLRTCQLLRKRP